MAGAHGSVFEQKIVELAVKIDFIRKPRKNGWLVSFLISRQDPLLARDRAGWDPQIALVIAGDGEYEITSGPEKKEGRPECFDEFIDFFRKSLCTTQHTQLARVDGTGDVECCAMVRTCRLALCVAFLGRDPVTRGGQCV